MSMYKLIIEPSEDGKELWGRLKYKSDLLTTSGRDLEEVKKNLDEQLKGFYQVELSKLKLEVEYDLATFFEQHPELHISAIADKAGINSALMRQYKRGIKFPSLKQLRKIEEAIHQIARDLSKVSFALVKG